MTSSHCSLHCYAPCIKNSTATFVGSHGHCSQNDQLHSCQKLSALPTSSQQNGSATYEISVLHQSLLDFEREMPLVCMNFTWKRKSFYERTKTISMSISTMNIHLHGQYFWLTQQNEPILVRPRYDSDVQDEFAGLSTRKAQIKAFIGWTFANAEDFIKSCITEHLKIHSAEFKSYFAETPLDVPWHRDPFNTEIEHEAEELAEFKVSKAIKLAIS